MANTIIVQADSLVEHYTRFAKRKTKVDNVVREQVSWPLNSLILRNVPESDIEAQRAEIDKAVAQILDKA